MADEPVVPDDKKDPAPPVDTTDWKAEARKHESRSKKAAKDIEDLQAKLAEHADAAKSEQDKAIDALRKEAADAARAEVSQDFRTRILRAEIRAQAAGKFANPALAAKLLDLNADEVFTDDEPDTKAIGTAIDDFLKAEENAGLRANAAPPPLVKGGADAGKGSPAQELDALIREAEEKGDVRTSIRLKRQKLLHAST